VREVLWVAGLVWWLRHGEERMRKVG
jgi:hypothetical protein